MLRPVDDPCKVLLHLSLVESAGRVRVYSDFITFCNYVPSIDFLQGCKVLEKLQVKTAELQKCISQVKQGRKRHRVISQIMHTVFGCANTVLTQLTALLRHFVIALCQRNHDPVFNSDCVTGAWSITHGHRRSSHRDPPLWIPTASNDTIRIKPSGLETFHSRRSGDRVTFRDGHLFIFPTYSSGQVLRQPPPSKGSCRSPAPCLGTACLLRSGWS